MAAGLILGHAHPRLQEPAPPFYRDWTMADLLPSVAGLGAGRDWAQGRDVFRKAGCGACHAFGSESEGGGLAPDLTSVGTTSGNGSSGSAPLISRGCDA